MLVAAACIAPVACSTSDSGTEPAAATGPRTDVVATSRVDELFEHPTQALVDGVLADHVPTADEADLIAVYWAGMIVASDTGELPEEFVSTGLMNQVLALAVQYPSFFRADPSGAPAPVPANVGIRDLPGAPPGGGPNGGCGNLCYSPLGAKTFATTITKCVGATGIVKGIRALKNGPEVVTKAKAAFDAYRKALTAGLKPGEAITAAMEGKSAELTFAIVDGALNAVAVLAAAGAIVLSAKALAAITIVAGISSAIQCGSGAFGIVNAVSDLRTCKTWVSDHCVDAGPPDAAKPDAALPPGCAPGERYTVLSPPSADCGVADGTGLVKDNTTGLTWTAKPYFPPAGQRTQTAAEAYCAGQGMRLPTKPEALGIAGSGFVSCAFCSWFTWTSTSAGAGLFWRVTASGGSGSFAAAGDGNDRVLCVK